MLFVVGGGGGGGGGLFVVLFVCFVFVFCLLVGSYMSFTCYRRAGPFGQRCFAKANSFNSFNSLIT